MKCLKSIDGIKFLEDSVKFNDDVCKIIYQCDPYYNGVVRYRIIVCDKLIFILEADWVNDIYTFCKINRIIHDYDKIFIGKDSEDKFIGNTIVIKLNNNNSTENSYLYIDRLIREFTTEFPIENYYSPIGKSMIPYPFAVTKDKTYLMLERKYIMNDEYNYEKDPYLYFWGLDGRNKVEAYTY